MSAPSYPIFLRVEDRPVVIIGGGTVAARKVGGLLAAGAKKIRVVALQFKAEFAPSIERIESAYHRDHLAGASLVFAATDQPAVNDQIVKDAGELGIWVNRADDSDENPGDFITPAVHRSGPLSIAVSASGTPTLAAAVRDELSSKIDPTWATLASWSLALRPRVLAGDYSVARRRAMLHLMASALPLQSDVKSADELWAFVVEQTADR